MAENVVLTINMDANCVECLKPGATPSGLCLTCACKAMRPDATMKSREGRAVQARYASMRDRFSALRMPSGKTSNE